MAATIVVVQDAGESYAGYAQEVAKNIFYMIPIASATANRTLNPMPIPAVGTNYSYEVWLRCRCDLAPVVKCYNFNAWYVSGIPVSGYKVTVNSDIVSAYITPVDSLSAIGNRVDFSGRGVGSEITINGELTNLGDYSSYLVFQLEVSAGAASGDSEVSWIIEYDEV